MECNGSERPGSAAPPYDVVVFDCDSTLSRIEGIEDLAREQADEIRALTDRAMLGEVPLEEVYGRRLELIRPSRAALARVADRYGEEALPGAAHTVATLRELGKEVRVVSGGLLPCVRPFAARLGIDPELVFAVDAATEEDGSWQDFDRASPLARAGGKLDLLRSWGDLGSIALVGDGATDLEAAPACARFIAFTAVAARPAVVAGADAVCAGPGLDALLPLLLTPEELATLEPA